MTEYTIFYLSEIHFFKNFGVHFICSNAFNIQLSTQMLYAHPGAHSGRQRLFFSDQVQITE